MKVTLPFVYGKFLPGEGVEVLVIDYPEAGLGPR
jgi:hypothetical protein